MDTTNSNQKQKQKTIDENLQMAKFMVSTNQPTTTEKKHKRLYLLGLLS